MKSSSSNREIPATRGNPFGAAIQGTSRNLARLRITFKVLALCLVKASQNISFAADKEHLLQPEDKLLRDAPLPLFKSTWEILQENWLVLMIIAGAAFLFAFVWWLRKRLLNRKSKNVEETPERDPYEEAIDALGELDAKKKRMEAKPFTFRLSEVLRVYVQRRFELPAMELTGEEFLREAAEHNFFRNHYDDLLREFIDRSDVVKYSRESIDGEGLSLLMNSAMHFVRDTHRRLEERLTRETSDPGTKAK